MKNIFCFSITLFFSVVTAATWLEPSQIRKDVQAVEYSKSNTSETEFKEIVKTLQDLYSPMANAHGAKLSLSGEWKNEKLNAGARQIGSTWQVVITGGLARRPELTPEGFSLILCHELGHHFGGFSIAPAGTPFEKAWASNEGQADYFSTQVCARKLWGNDLVKNAEFRKTATDKILRQCDGVWTNIEDQNLCYRILTGVESMTTTMANLLKKPAPDFDTPDVNTVTQTSHKHPAVQCRMDTALQGALCLAVFNSAIIPGKFTEGGVQGIEAEREAATFSCSAYSGFSVGLRPGCWFKPRL